MSEEQNSVSDILEDNTYKYGFTTDVESETFAKGLNEEVVRAISKKKNEPKFERLNYCENSNEWGLHSLSIELTQYQCSGFSKSFRSNPFDFVISLYFYCSVE